MSLFASMQGQKVVTAKEMARVEAFASEQKREEFMNRAGEGVARIVEVFCIEKHIPRKATVLIGKGNKGGDAFVCARILLERGFSVRAFCLADFRASSPLCQLQGKKFLSQGGDIHFLESAFDLSFEKSGVIVDGLFGTGFEGALEGLAQQVVEKVNQSSLPIIAIDIPSGLNGSTGEVITSAIKAKVTAFLGLPKIGFFLHKGYNHVGDLRRVDFGLDEEAVEAAHPLAYLVDETKLSKTLPPIIRTRHKYQRGYVVAVAGSQGMAGAAKLTALASLRAGAGIVRLFHSEDVEAEMVDTPMEIIHEKWKMENVSTIADLSSKAGAILLGPGMGRGKVSEDFFRAVLPKIEKPTVLDADALFLLAKHPSLKLPKETILTPHHQEMVRLLGESESPHDFFFLEKCRHFAGEKKVTLILKGAPTFIFYPGLPPFVIPRGDPGMATAGAGDVLTGIVAALLAQGLDSYHAALLGVYLHAIAGEIAARKLTSYAVIASDLIQYLPDAFQKMDSSRE